MQIGVVMSQVQNKEEKKFDPQQYEYIIYEGTEEQARKEHEQKRPWFPFCLFKKEKNKVYIFANWRRKME